MTRTRLLWSFLLFVMAGIASVSLLENRSAALAGPKISPQPLAVYGQIPGFLLLDQTGQSFDQSSMRGKIWIADFIFTSCAGQCPLMTSAMRALQEKLPAAVQFVSITVDPQRDTPAVLSEYAERSRADTQRWHFLTGDRAQIEQLCLNGFRLSYAEGGSPTEPITHSSRFMLIDEEGKIRGIYDGTDPASNQRLIQEVRTLLEKSSRRGS